MAIKLDISKAYDSRMRFLGGNNEKNGIRKKGNMTIKLDMSKAYDSRIGFLGGNNKKNGIHKEMSGANCGMCLISKLLCVDQRPTSWENYPDQRN